MDLKLINMNRWKSRWGNVISWGRVIRLRWTLFWKWGKLKTILELIMIIIITIIIGLYFVAKLTVKYGLRYVYCVEIRFRLCQITCNWRQVFDTREWERHVTKNRFLLACSLLSNCIFDLTNLHLQCAQSDTFRQS